PAEWVTSSAPLTIQASFSKAGTYDVVLTDVCHSTAALTATGDAVSGINTITLDGLTPEPLPEGSYLATLTPKSVDGTAGVASSATVSVVSSPTAAQRTICSNASRIRLAADTDKALAQAAVTASHEHFADAEAVVLIPTSASPGFLAVATVYARLNEMPLLFSAGDKLTYATKQELVRRKPSKVVVLGPKDGFSPKVMATLKSLGLKVPLRTAKSAAELGALLYPKSNIAAETPAVFVNFKTSESTLMQAVSFASATGRPLLDLDGSSLTTTRATIKALGTKGGIAIGGTSSISDKGLTSFKKVVRVSAKDDRSLALSLARSATDPVATVVLRSATSKLTRLDYLAFNIPALTVVVDSKGLTLDQRAWLNARGDIQNLFSTSASASLTDFAMARVAAVVLKRGEPTVIPVLEALPLGPLTAPATFAFSGSGWGHGIGMSQWGAYAMAKAGKSEADILTHYYTNTTVEPVADDADVFVGLCVDTDSNCYRNANRVSSIKLRLKPTGGSTPSMKLQAADGTAVTITTAHTVTFTFIKSSTMIKTTITGTDAPTLKNSSMVIITWSGTRISGTLGDEAGVAQVAGPGGDLAAGRTYRFGSMRVRAGAAQTDLIAGMSLSNRVRLHDEYLYGIGEVSSSWPAAALRAQVIAARSYVYNDVYNSDGTTRPRRSACDCQVYGDIRDQNYVGWSKISSVKGDLWKAAVDATLASETTGMAVVNGRNVVQTFFAAANGGATQNNEDVWGGTGRSYLRSVDDPWTLMPPEAVTVTAWSPRVRTQQVVAAAFGLPNVATLDMSDRFASGALRSVTATSTTGAQTTISGEKFRGTMVSDTGSSLMSTWVWRSIVTPTSKAAPGLSEEFIKDRFFGFCKAPGSTAKKAVLVSGIGEAGPAIVTAAASYAAVTGAALIVTKNSGDATRIKTLLAAQAIASVAIVGTIDSAITSAMTTAKISWRVIQGSTLSDLTRRLATDAAVSADKGIVVASASEPAAWPLAVSVSARTGRPLLFATNKALSADVVSWISSASPASIYVVGSTAEIPDAALAGFADVSRVTTSDLPLASLALLGRSAVTVRGVILMSASSDPLTGVIAAISGMPIVYEDATTTSAVVDWLRRQPLAAAVVNLGVTPEFLQQIRRA
ncbi:MAG: hypothetical protein RL441_1446, partial [Actinomycetota bacterium]